MQVYFNTFRLNQYELLIIAERPENISAPPFHMAWKPVPIFRPFVLPGDKQDNTQRKVRLDIPGDYLAVAYAFISFDYMLPALIVMVEPIYAPDIHVEMAVSAETEINWREPPVRAYNNIGFS